MSAQGAFRARMILALRPLAILAAVCAFLVAPLARAQETEALPEVAKSPNGVYIVRLAESPVLSYDGTVPGYRATRAVTGRPDRGNADVKRYADYLKARHDTLVGTVGGKKLTDYVYTFNGFAAKLSPVQAAKLAATSGVLSVSPDEKRTIDTASTPAFLGLSAPGGLWDQLGGVGRAGDGVVVGIVDSGIWPENASFADDGSYRPIGRWKGECVTGEQWTTANCSNKVIGSRYYLAGYGNERPFSYEILSARDVDGHGSHTASTAAGNNGVPASVDGIALGKISGMAPRARIAIYKVCWGNGTEGGCFNSDSVSAIEDATMDGVDVINFSISGSQTSVTDPVEIAFLEAASAGVFVAASAGNSGPTAGTVAHNSPWITTVAASTHDRVYQGTVTLGNGATYTGASLTAAAGPAPLIPSTAAGLAGADPTQVRLCFSGTLDPAKVTGKIVQCDRGSNARTDKSLAVKQAGGVGMILTNTSPNSLNADIHYVPTVHVDNVAGAAIKAYITSAGAGATASLSQGQLVPGAEAPFMASFSSRGPNRYNGDLLKPDITAPGVDVLAAFSPALTGRNYDFLSGTSMSSPHIAGIAALLKDLHPSWLPSEIKSAMMTTASQKTNKGNPIDGGPQAYGAGHVTPNSAADPGLVYTARPNDYIRFLCGQGALNEPRCPALAIDASDLNLASIAIGDLAGVQTVKRTVKNVSDKTATYTVSVQAPTGINVQVSPSTLTIKPGESASYTVTFTQVNAAFNAFTYGAITWSDGTHNVRSPLSIRSVRLAAPALFNGTGTSGSGSYALKFGYAGAFSAQPHGLVPAATYPGTVAQDPTQTFVPGGPGTTSFTVNIPAGVEYARFSLFTADTDSPNNDLDLYVYRNGAQVGGSGSGTSDEEVNFTKPAAGTYTVYVHGFGTDGPSANFTLFVWQLTAASAGNLTVNAPTSATIGTTTNVTLNWSGLTPATKYLGTVTYHNVAAPSSYDDGRIGTTFVRINTP